MGAPKGLSVLLPLVKAFPQEKFAVIATSWVSKDIRGMLSVLYNVKVWQATRHLDKVYSVTKVLLAPSLWPEAYGLVVMEAALRGVPCLSSASGGLPEANVLADVGLAVK